MRISFNWLKDFIDITQTPQEIAALLTDCGLEVENMEEWESIKGGLSGLRVGKVLECVKHPNADKLSLCKVDAGTGEALQIVCGAPNVAAGQKVIVAWVGTKLFPTTGEPFEIKKSKIRGEESNGMLCAEDEIGMGVSHAGLLILPDELAIGSSIADYFKVTKDVVFEIGLTPNRADAASHLGVARDLKALLSKEKQVVFKMPDISSFKEVANTNPIEVVVKDKDACQRYSGVCINNVQVKESPAWLQNRLKAIGMRPINNIVDATNYVMMELGQPLHAFDADKIAGNKIIVQQLPSGTIFKTLDEVERKLNGTELMICDEKEGLCIAGVFGGIESGVTDNSKNIFLESACFNPVSIRKTSKLHGLKTDSSFRFERGTDPDNTVNALKRAALLICELSAGKISSALTDIYPQPLQPFKVRLHFDYLKKLTGAIIPLTDVKRILESLSIVIKNETTEYLDLSVPRFKVDVTREADVIEEILRIYGYNNIPLPKKMNSSLPVFNNESDLAWQQKLSYYLSAQGFNEILNNSLTKSIYHDLLSPFSRTISPDSLLPLEKVSEGQMRREAQGVRPVELLNPLSNDLNVMRSHMLFNGLESIAYNQNRKQSNIRFFEFGKTYFSYDKGFNETARLALWLSGERYDENWQQLNRKYDVYYLKSIIDNLFSLCAMDKKNLKIEEMNPDASGELYSQALKYSIGKKELVVIGAVNKSITKKFDIQSTVFYADINWENVRPLLNSVSQKVKEVSRFPEVKRDLSMLLDRKVKYEEVEKIAFDTEQKILKEVRLFDVYEGEKIDKEKKSYAVSFILLDEQKTLEEKQIENIMKKLMNNFEQKLGAVIRK